MCPADSVPTEERLWSEGAVFCSAQPLSVDHHIPGNRAPELNCLSETAANQVLHAEGPHIQAGERDQRVQEAAGRRGIRTKEVRNIYQNLINDLFKAVIILLYHISTCSTGLWSSNKWQRKLKVRISTFNLLILLLFWTNPQKCTPPFASDDDFCAFCRTKTSHWEESEDHRGTNC